MIILGKYVLISFNIMFQNSYYVVDLEVLLILFLNYICFKLIITLGTLYRIWALGNHYSAN